MSTAAQRRSGGGGMGGPGTMMDALTATPELMAAVDALPPPRDTPSLMVDATAPDPEFRLARLLHPVRWLVAAAVTLVALDALSSLAFPNIARYAVDNGITGHAPGVLVGAVLLGVGIVAASWFVVALGRSPRHGPGRACSTCCGCAATPTCSGSASTTTSASCPAGS